MKVQSLTDRLLAENCASCSAARKTSINQLFVSRQCLRNNCFTLACIPSKRLCFFRLSLIVASSIYVIFVIKSRIGGWGGIGETILAMSGFESPKVQNTPPCLASSCNLRILVELWKNCDRGVVQVAAIFARQVADRAGCHCSGTPTGG